MTFFNSTPEPGHGGARNFKREGCCGCDDLRARLEQARQAYRELEDALAIADARSIPESITSTGRALSVAIYERMERCKGQMGESSSSAAPCGEWTFT